MREFIPEEFMGAPMPTVFRPAGCPADFSGQPIDLSETPLVICVDSAKTQYSPENYDQLDGDIAEFMAVWFAFAGRDETGWLKDDQVTTGVIVARTTDPLIRLAEELDANPNDPRLAQIHAELVMRTKRCVRAVNGQCWALGERALREILEPLLPPPPEELPSV